MIRIVFITLFLIFTLVRSTTAFESPDFYPYYQFINYVDVAVIGDIVAIKDDKEFDALNMCSIKISEVLKGEFQTGDVIQFWSHKHPQSELDKGKEALIFLSNIVMENNSGKQKKAGYLTTSCKLKSNKYFGTEKLINSLRAYNNSMSAGILRLEYHNGSYEEIPYTADKALTGKAKVYGPRYITADLLNGQLHGMLRIFNKQNKIFRECSFRHGKKHGLCAVYHPNGMPNRLVTWEEDQRLHFKEFAPNGELLRERSMEEDTIRDVGLTIDNINTRIKSNIGNIKKIQIEEHLKKIRQKSR